MGKKELQRKKRSRFTYRFTKTEFLRIADEAMLSDYEKNLLEDKIKGMSIIQMSEKYHASPETIKNHINKMKDKILKVI